jgi:hypothetical protein
MTKGQKIISENYRHFIENAGFPIVIFRFEDNKIKIVMASQGFLSMKAPHLTREQAILKCEKNFFKDIDANDLQRYQEVFEDFVTDQMSRLDLMMHMHVADYEDDSLVHLKGYHVQSAEGKDCLCLYYDILTGIQNGLEEINGWEKPILKMLTSAKSPYAIVEKKTNRILLMNDAMSELCFPGQEYEEGMAIETFLLGKGTHYAFDLESYVSLPETIFPRPSNIGDLIIHVFNVTFHGQQAYGLRIQPLDYKYYDALTNMRSTNFFRERGNQILKELLERHEQPAIVYMDLRNMKIYNKMYGFNAGDDL